VPRATADKISQNTAVRDEVDHGVNVFFVGAGPIDILDGPAMRRLLAVASTRHNHGLFDEVYKKRPAKFQLDRSLSSRAFVPTGSHDIDPAESTIRGMWCPIPGTPAKTRDQSLHHCSPRLGAGSTGAYVVRAEPFARHSATDPGLAVPIVVKDSGATALGQSVRKLS